MFHTPQILPISDMRNRHVEVMDKLTNGPVFLTRRGEGAAVLLSNEQWSTLMHHVEEQADRMDVLEAMLAETQGELAQPFQEDELTVTASSDGV
ncbi:MAG: type II toxin-antitoxin system prevent-host-death family antitoxin [Chloroflexota bacterium]